jgi:hypothetical protein
VVVTNIEGINFYVVLGSEEYHWIVPQTSETYIGSYEYVKGDELFFVWDMKDDGASWLLKSSNGSIKLLSYKKFNSPPADTDRPQQDKAKNDLKSQLPKRL